MILVDTSIWADHFRQGDIELVQQLERRTIAMHAFVIGELALGRLPRRVETLQDLAVLPRLSTVSEEMLLELIERHALVGRGIGYVDVHLLCAAVVNSARLWTRDKRLASVATSLDLAFGAH